MNWIESLEKRFGSWAVPHLAVYLIMFQIVGAILLMGNYIDVFDMLLKGHAVLHEGKWWQLLSFMMIPKNLNPIWLFFSLYIFYLMGSALEQQWGRFRFNLFILCGYLLTVVVAFIIPRAIITNFYFLGCVFLAFATLFPNFEFYLFFILPVKVKWLGWLTAAFYLFILVAGDTGSRLSVGAAFANYALFFGRDFIGSFRAGQRRKAFIAGQAEVDSRPMHVCAECGITDKSAPNEHFRYCSTCRKCYCEKHIEQHQHD